MPEPLPQVRVLIVDDSVVMRRVLARTLERDPSVGRTDFAGNGRVALAKILERRPDVVVLDLEMPVLDGFETLREIRRLHPQLPVVLFSSLEESYAAATLDAMSLGATDFVEKPTTGGIDEAEAYVAEKLVPLVVGLGADRGSQPRPAAQTLAAASRVVVDAVVVAVSTGGPDALATVLQLLPAQLPVPVLVVQHMPPMFTRLLAERLHRQGGLTVREAQDGDVLRASTVYIAPGDRHLQLERSAPDVRAVLDDGPRENSCRPAADVLFRSAAQVYGSGALGIVLTGMGRDGLRGCEAVRAAGGQVLVQDPATAVVSSMPAAVLDAGLASASLPLDLLVADVVKRVAR